MLALFPRPPPPWFLRHVQYIVRESHVFPGSAFCYSVVLQEVCLPNIFEIVICSITGLCGLKEKRFGTCSGTLV